MLEKKKAVTVLIFNKSGELLMQLRAAGDASFPSHWDFSVSGGIDADEDPELAGKREAREELGIDVGTIEFVAHEIFRYPAWGDGHPREIENFIYKTRHDGPFNPDPNEVADARFFKVAEIEHMIQQGEKLHPEFVLAWKQGIIAKTSGLRNAIADWK